MEQQYPIHTRTMTADGWIDETDYGPKLGVSRVIIHVPPPDPVAARRNREGINRVLAEIGLKLAE